MLDPEGTVRLLSAILWELPSLSAAAWRERSGLFDDHCNGEPREQRTERLGAAVAVCRRCPELVVCERLPLPRGGGVGVVAGRVLGRLVG